MSPDEFLKSRSSWPIAQDAVVACIAGLLLGTIFAIGRFFYMSPDSFTFSNHHLWTLAIRNSLFAAIIIFFTLCIWRRYLSVHSTSIHVEQQRLPLALWMESHPSVRILIFTISIITIWIPAFLAFFPGNYSSDGPIQVTYLLNDGILDFHWPPAHTLLMAGCILLGNTIFGTYDAGLSMFCWLQAVSLATALAYGAHRALAWRCPVWVVAIGYGAIVFNPVVQTYAFTTAKDSMFAAFFITVLILLTDMVRDTSLLQKVSFIIVFVLAATGMSLMRKQGLLVLSMMLILALIIVHNWWQRLSIVIIIVATFIISGIFPIMVSHITPIREDSSREILSLPSQQIVRTYMYDYDSLTNRQLQEIGRYYDLKQLESGRTTSRPYDEGPIGEYYDLQTGTGYLAPLSDPTKGALREENFNNDSMGYLRMYFSVMKGHETDYIIAFLWGEIGYLYPTTKAFNRWTGLSPWNEFSLSIADGGTTNQISDYNVTSKLPSYLSWLHHGTWDMFKNIPSLTFWVSPAFPFLILTFTVLLLLRRTGKRRYILVWLLPFVYWASLCLAPVMCIRYVVPIFFSAPILLTLPFMQEMETHFLKDGIKKTPSNTNMNVEPQQVLVSCVGSSLLNSVV